MNKPIRSANELLDDFSFSIAVELERLSYFEVLFKAIRTDLTNKGHSAKALASLGEYLAQDFTYYSQLDLEQLEKEQEV
ncbi:hypothetical protein [Psychrobacter phenylpyruvicus]|uniref:Uncharacterized protein n=1 Tax=Psychrobacter phenylpyruvicus TaxID=29432 RepID=A0A379LNE8_9GAMM|nr:hypothetical protein [Psychrobacter phenylpyruvicus]SUD92073.1 Uncharacterised protein [Psychrobacter phenylpyruvicus]